jgi:hypothetical protein
MKKIILTDEINGKETKINEGGDFTNKLELLGTRGI